MTTLDTLFSTAIEHSRQADVRVTSLFGIHHGTQLAGSSLTFQTRYVLARVGRGFGACAVERLPLDEAERAALCGMPVADLLGHPEPSIRVAVLDAWLSHQRPWTEDAQAVILPAGTPEVRAAARDEVVASLLDLVLADTEDGQPSGTQGTAPQEETSRGAVALIGVVNPLVAAIRARGYTPLPCDLWLRETAFGDAVAADFREVVPQADAVIATGMTLGNGSYPELAALCRAHGIPLALYAQSGSAIARELVGSDLAAASCEPFPFSQFTADASLLHVVAAG